MYATQLLVQMAAASTAVWTGQTASSGKTSVQDQGTSFQTLLRQRQERFSQDSGADGEKDAASQTPAEDPLPEENKTQDNQSIGMDLAALGAALLANGVIQVQPKTCEAAAPQTQEVVQPVPAEEMVPAEPESVQSASALPAQEQPVMPQTEQPVTGPRENLPLTQAPMQIQVSEKILNAKPSATDEHDTFAADRNQQDTQSVRQEDMPQVTDSTGGWHTPVFEQTEQMPVKVGESVTVDTTTPAAQLEQELGKVLDRGLKDGEQHLTIQLSPANLGTVTAEFVRSPEGALHVVLRAENPQAAKLLGDHAGALGLLLQDGTRGEVRVEVPQPQQDQQLWQQPDQGSGHQQQQQQQHRAPRQETESFLHQLRLGLVETGAEENV